MKRRLSDRIWTRKDALINDLDTEITRNIMLGRGVQDSAQAIAKKFNTTANRAATLVYTESAPARGNDRAAIASQAQKDMFEELGVEEYEIVATLNEATCEICQELDGKHFPRSEYKVGVTAHPFHPNCHCATAPYFDDEFSFGTRAARDPETEKTVSVPEDMTYPEWKKVFVDKTETVAEWKAAKNSAPEGVAGEKNVTKDYMDKAKPGRGKISYEEGYDKDNHTNEIKTADWLLKNLGGEIKLLKESTKDGEKMPDYRWNGKLWELKNPGTAEASNSAVRTGIKQISPDPGGIILNYGNTGVELNAIIAVVDKRMQWLKEGIEIDVMIIINDEMKIVIRYKK